MWPALLPDTCVTMVAPEPGAAPRLSPAEEGRLRRFVPRRRAEFRAGRAAAAQALRALGLTRPERVGVGPRGEPLWPAGFVGSITHTAGHCAATVARSRDFQGLGIDVEAHEPLDLSVRPMVLDAREEAMVAEVSGRSGGLHLCRLVFCVKEAVFKCLYPRTGQFLEFRDVSVTLEPATGRFSARIQARAGPPRIEGRFAADARYLYVGATWPSA